MNSNTNDFYILFVEKATGIVLTEDGEYRIDKATPRRTFTDLEEAKSFAEQYTTSKSWVEIGIYNSHDECLISINSDFS